MILGWGKKEKLNSCNGQSTRLCKLCPADGGTFTIGVIQLCKPPKNPLFLVPYSLCGRGHPNRRACVENVQEISSGSKRTHGFQTASFRAHNRAVHELNSGRWTDGGGGGRAVIKIEIPYRAHGNIRCRLSICRSSHPLICTRIYNPYTCAYARVCIFNFMTAPAPDALYLGPRTQCPGTITSFVSGPQTDKTYVVFRWIRRSTVSYPEIMPLWRFKRIKIKKKKRLMKFKEINLTQVLVF